MADSSKGPQTVLLYTIVRTRESRRVFRYKDALLSESVGLESVGVSLRPSTRCEQPSPCVTAFYVGILFVLLLLMPTVPDKELSVVFVSASSRDAS